MSNVTTIGLDIAKSVFQAAVWMLLERLPFGESLHVGACCHSSKSCRDAWLVSGRAVLRTTGRVNSLLLATMCGCCRQGM